MKSKAISKALSQKRLPKKALRKETFLNTAAVRAGEAQIGAEAKETRLNHCQKIPVHLNPFAVKLKSRKQVELISINTFSFVSLKLYL